MECTAAPEPSRDAVVADAVGQAPLHNMIHWFTSGFGISPGDEDSHGGMGAIESGGGADDEEG